MDVPKVNVLMSTYNGEKFIREQIDSILKQKDVDVQLLIRDDGSMDHTIEIINEYAKRFPNVYAYMGENLGVGKSFMELLKNAPKAEYYAFADQDDVWLEDKLSRAVGIIQKTEKSDLAKRANEMDLKPVLYGSNQKCVDENLKFLNYRYKRSPRGDMFQAISQNKVSGCTMVMNQALREELLKESHYPTDKTLDLRIHDTWCMIVSNIVGEFVWDKESRILYRQHKNNVVGAKKRTKIEIIKDKIFRLSSKKYKGERSRIANEILDNFQYELSAEDKSDLENIANCKSIRGAIRLIRNPNVRPVFSENTVVLFIKAVSGWI